MCVVLCRNMFCVISKPCYTARLICVPCCIEIMSDTYRIKGGTPVCVVRTCKVHFSMVNMYVKNRENALECRRGVNNLVLPVIYI